MADAQIPNHHWRALQRSANCFLPKLVDALSEGGVSNSEFSAAGRDGGVYDLSVQVIGKVLRLQAVTHSKLAQVVKAYVALRNRRPELPEITEKDIVGAFFEIPKLKDLMQSSGFEISGLSSASGVGYEAIEHAMNHGRVPAGVVSALRRAIPNTPPIDQFCTSRPFGSKSGTSVASDVFRMEDLKLLPDAGVGRWP